MAIESIISFLHSRQTAEGEFQSQCYLPTADEPIWYYSGPSPFLSANVLYCLSEVENPIAREMLSKGKQFLLSLREKSGWWRYWEHNSPIMEYNVPCDMDDTSLCGYLLREELDITDTAKTLFYNLHPEGSFYTWLLPRKSFLSNVSLYAYALKELVKTRAIFLPNKKIPNNEPISSIYDREAGVDANALLFLGSNKRTKTVIKKLMADTKKDTYSLQYYDHNFYVHYHLSRAYRAGITELEDVKDAVMEHINQVNFSYDWQENYLRYIFNTLTLINFNLTSTDTFKQYIAFIKEDPMLDGDWKAFKYWTSKQRSWWAGSPEMTAALYLEALSKYEKI